MLHLQFSYKNPNLYNSHVKFEQNHDCRIPAPFYIFGKSAFDDNWKLVLEGMTKKKEVIETDLFDFQRNHQCKVVALVYFIKPVKCNRNKTTCSKEYF